MSEDRRQKTGGRRQKKQEISPPVSVCGLRFAVCAITDNRKPKTHSFLFSFLVPLFSSLIFLFLLSLPLTARAEELKIAFTGQSYSMLYPCSCPREPDGGVARRAAFLKKLRASAKNVLVLEAGGSFASGPEDQHSQNAENDERRTELYLKAVSAMGYDALLASAQEYRMGGDFLKRHLDLPFLTSNMEAFPRPYVIRDFGVFKVGIIGLTGASVTSKGIAGWQNPSAVLKSRVREVKKEGADIVILLSSLKAEEDKALLAGVEGVDVVINGSPSLGSVKIEEHAGSVYLSTWWQARRVGVLTLEVSGQKIAKRDLESFRLSAETGEDEVVSKTIPACFSDGDCPRPAGAVMRCENPGGAEARCLAAEQPKISVTVVRPRVCSLCRTEEVLDGLRQVFGKLDVRYLFEDEPAARDIIREFGISMLPAYLFGKDIEQSARFGSFSALLNRGSSFHMLKPVHAGVSYFLGNERIPKKLDVFFDFGYKDLSKLLGLLEEFKKRHRDVSVVLHFLAIQDNDGTFISKGGVRETEEFARAACVGVLDPEKLIPYLACRALQKDSSWWDECAASVGIEGERVKDCVFSAQGKEAMRQRTQLTEKLKLASGPAFVVDNKEVFGISAVPSLEEFEAAALGQKEKGGEKQR